MTTKAKTGFSQPQPNYLAASKRESGGLNLETLQAFQSLDARVSAVEQKAGTGTVNSQGTPIIPPPAQAGLAVNSPTPGNVVVMITNPQYIQGQTPGSVRGNAIGTGIIHKVAYSSSPTFPSGTTTTLPPSVQTHYSIPITGPVYVKLQSSHDGQTYNAAQISAGVQA